MSSKSPNALLHGTLDALILKTLASGPRHGYAIARFIEDTTGEAVLVEEGSLYPALYRMERRGWLEGKWVEKAGQRRRRYYKLTSAGRKVLGEQRASWQELLSALQRVTGIVTPE
jgi:transcriptional regulator